MRTHGFDSLIVAWYFPGTDASESGQNSGIDFSRRNMYSVGTENGGNVAAGPEGGLDSLFNLLLDTGAARPSHAAPSHVYKPKKRKRTKNGAYLDDITKSQLLGLTHLPTAKAAEALKIGTTSFKRVCRLHGIETWPYKGRLASNSPEAHQNVTEPASSRLSHGQQDVSVARHSDECQRLIDIVSDDIRKISDLRIPIQYATDPASIASLVETMNVSQTMRRTSGVSIFNDGVLLKLLERITMAGGRPLGGAHPERK